MNPVHRVSLHLSRNNSLVESPKDQNDWIEAGFSKSTENLEMILQRHDKLQELLPNTGEQYKPEGQEKDIVYYKKLVKQLERDKKELEDKNRELNSLLKDLRPKPGVEKIIESSKQLFKEFGLKNKEVERNCGAANEFLGLVKMGNVQEALVRTLALSKELMRGKKEVATEGSVSPRLKISKFIEDDVSQLIQEKSVRALDEKLKIVGRKSENSGEKHFTPDSPFISTHLNSFP